MATESLQTLAESFGRTTTINRSFKAPRALVFRTFVEPEHLKKWFRASEDWTTPYAEVDLRPGGAYRIGFGSPDGANDFDFEATFREIIEPELLVYMLGEDRIVVVTFVEDGDMTTVTMQFTLETENSEEMQRGGWGAMLENLATHLSTLSTN